jgi:hypothetical protein
VRVPLLGALLGALALPAVASGATCDVDMRIEAQLRLGFTYTCDAPLRRLDLHEARARLYIADVTLGDGTALVADDDGWTLPDAGARRFGYRLDLAALAASVGRPTAQRIGDSILAPVASWLMEPRGAESGVAIRIAATAADDLGFASAMPLADGRYHIDGRGIWAGGHTAFGKLGRNTIRLPHPRGEAALEVVRLDGSFALPLPELLAWVERSARAVAAFYSGFPAERAMLAVLPVPTRRVGFGQVMAGGGASIMLQVGSDVTREALDDDWVLVHELAHVGMPFLFDQGGRFLMEGLATYIEPLIRARARLRSAEWAWHELQAGMPRGGMYWGGAATLLAADVAKRHRTAGRRGLEHCLRDVLWQHGNASLRWRTQQFVEACDAAIGAPVLAETIARGSVDLPTLWRELGVEAAGEAVRLRDDAPAARLRDAILGGAG